MKKSFKLLYILAAVLLLAGCESEPILWDSSKSFVAFTSTGTAANEQNPAAVGIPVLVTAGLDAPAVTVSFEFVTEGITNPAVPGTDFTLLNDAQTLDFADGYGYDTIWIAPIDNDVFTGNKTVAVVLTSNSQDYPFGALSTHILTLKDNEHPLGKWIGTYDVAALSYGDPGNWDEAWTVVNEPDPDDVNNLLMTGFGGPAYSSHTAVVGAVDMDAMTITLLGGSEIGTHGLYGGPLAIFFGDEAGGIASLTDPMVGELSEDGSIRIDHVAIKFVGGINTGYVWDSFDLHFTKQAKKSAEVKGFVPDSKHSNLK